MQYENNKILVTFMTSRFQIHIDFCFGEAMENIYFKDSLICFFFFFALVISCCNPLFFTLTPRLSHVLCPSNSLH